MPTRYWTCHWQNRFWRNDVNDENEPINHSAGNSFTKRGISPGDVVYIISMIEGQLYLGGKMTVDQILGYDDAVDFFGHDNIYEADEHLIGVDDSGTPLHLQRRLTPALTKQLRFETKSGPKGPFFVSETRLDNQATRGIRELTAESAALFDRIIGTTDQLPTTGELLTVTDELLGDVGAAKSDVDFRFPEEVPVGTVFREGSVRRVEVNRYERDSKARDACIALHGTDCCICGFSFAMMYGDVAAGYIHVHHLRSLADIGGEYEVDPNEDLRPVCPNCHAVLHLRGVDRSIEDVRRLVEENRRS